MTIPPIAPQEAPIAVVGMMNKIFAPLFAVIWTIGSILQYTGVAGPIPDSLIAITFSCIWIAIWQGQK